ncbi:hypothetical protein KC571_00110, partial [candidate division WWE3 bacterium]|nr:hypothetical protein [candidate division WWE3 bacterium]
ATFLFSLLVNGLTIEWLMKKLGVHLPKKEDLILKEELDILRINHTREHLESLCELDEFNTSIVQSVSSTLAKEVDEHKVQLLKLAKQDEVAKSLRLQAIVIEKKTIERLFDENHISEAVFFDLDSELDLQQDALEYPEVYTGRGYKRGGVIDRDKTFRERMRSVQESMNRFPLLGSFISTKREHIIENRIAALQTRIVCSNEVIKYLKNVEECIEDRNGVFSAIQTVKGEYAEHKKNNDNKLADLTKEYPDIAATYQTKVVQSIIKHEYAHHHPSHLFMQH